MRSLRALENADIVVLVIDATQGLESQDLNLFWMAQRQGKGIVILVNKWDLVEKDTNTHIEYSKIIKDSISPFVDVPILYISAMSKQRIFQAMETIMQVYENLTYRIPTHKLNDFLLPILHQARKVNLSKSNLLRNCHPRGLRLHYFAIYLNMLLTVILDSLKIN